MSTEYPNSNGQEFPNIVSMHEHVADLLGAYAVHSVNDAETELVELHLEHCVLCQAELAEHFATAARLGAASVMPVAPRVWDSVLSQIRLTEAIKAPTANAPTALRSAQTSISESPIEEKLTGTQQSVSDDGGADDGGAKVIDFASASARINKRRTWRVAIAAAVATAAITIPIVSSLSGSSPSIAALAKRVASQSSSRSLTLKSEDGNELAKVVVGKDGQGYLTSDSLPKLASNKAYQLWAVTTSGPVSLGILGADPSVQAFATPSTYAALAISVEDSAGAAAPTPPIASAAV
jgi:Anti-sigma-K factor rskA